MCGRVSSAQSSSVESWVSGKRNPLRVGHGWDPGVRSFVLWTPLWRPTRTERGCRQGCDPTVCWNTVRVRNPLRLSCCRNCCRHATSLHTRVRSLTPHCFLLPVGCNNQPSLETGMWRACLDIQTPAQTPPWSPHTHTTSTPCKLCHLRPQPAQLSLILRDLRNQRFARLPAEPAPPQTHTPSHLRVMHTQVMTCGWPVEAKVLAARCCITG